MLKLTLKGLQANKIRFALTTFGVVLAVSFVVSALVLGDGLRRSFTGVSQDITSGVDIQVRAVSDFGDPPPLPPELVDVIAQVDGVAAAQANIEAGESAVRPIPPDGEPISIYGPPQLAFNWAEDAQMSPFELVTGAAPLPGEFVMDIDSAADHGFVVGDVYDVFTPSGLASLRLSGTFTFGPQNTTLGSLLMAMNTDEAADLFDKDGIDTVEVRVAPDADVATVQAQIAAVVPGLEVVDNATVLAETTAEFTEAVDIVQNILLGFGGVALFVSMFIIYNTFAIVIGQRTRELALLRTLGASPSQIRRSVMGESVVIGTLASALGIGGGVLTAKGIDALVAALGVG
ncbi:MAG: ABC transporter permease, partial [Acidimicrobiales bacterium]|nr:ABC transporter permease [Acidimicrobiales bacterium]